MRRHTLRMEDTLAAKIRRLADEDRRTFAAELLSLVEEAIEARTAP